MTSESADHSSGYDLSNIQTSCKLALHGAAANSCPHSLLWVRAPPPCSSAGDVDGNANNDEGEKSVSVDTLVDAVIYASSGVINLATSHNCLSSNNVTSVDATLVTRTLDHSKESTTKKVLARGEAVEDAAAARSVTALSWIGDDENENESNVELQLQSNPNLFGIVAAFSDGTVTSWRYNNNKNCWMEHVLIGHDPQSTSTTSCERHCEDGMEKSNLQESIADISAANIDHRNGTGNSWLVTTASSKGIFLHVSHVTDKEESVHSRQIGHHAAASVQLQSRNNSGSGSGGIDECYLFAGSASPRHNKVWVYTIPYHSTSDSISDGDDNGASLWVSLPLVKIGEPIYHGHLLGHQDWITCFSWLDQFTSGEDNKGGEGRNESLLASSGHDAKIRLWKFSTWTSTAKDENVPELEGQSGGSDIDSEGDDDEAIIDDLEEEEGEARLIIKHTTSTTAVSLEALLLGHEEPVTSITWRKQTQSKDKPCLLSSSMDRTILLWMEEEYSNEGSSSAGATGGGRGGVWVPISRVGSAGGILGGSIGASLMGFVDATFSPNDANPRIVGHGYGGSVHFWTQVQRPENSMMELEEGGSAENEEEEDAMVSARWVADPCITGHFRPLEDMAWDPDGEYLLTTSSDQTTRLWMEVPMSNSTQCRWVEVGRPQVHGYDMTSIVCIGGISNGSNGESGEPCHRFVSGADEKVLRVFDAPASTLRTLRSITQSRNLTRTNASPEEGNDMNIGNQPSSWRVERAFMPSLGLSNKATADKEDQESSKFAGPVNDDDLVATLDTVEGSGGREAELKLPSERDLGVTTLWPEARKLFGHESELVCLDAYRPPQGVDEPTLVASSCLARNDVASAAIRLWDAKKGKCVGILKGGHRSTVSTMSFSNDGKYLASSGKDRRICIWKRASTSGPDNGPGYELCGAADSAHKRIVWSVHFCPKRSDILASGSRDGLIKIWRILEGGDGSLEIKELLRFESKAGKNPITAVSFAGDILECNGGNSSIGSGILAIGTESGRIEVWAVPIPPKVMDPCDIGETPSPVLVWAIPANDCHFDTVKKISWRPATDLVSGGPNEAGKIHLTLASCGQDNGVRIFEFKIKL